MMTEYNAFAEFDNTTGDANQRDASLNILKETNSISARDQLKSLAESSQQGSQYLNDLVIDDSDKNNIPVDDEMIHNFAGDCIVEGDPDWCINEDDRGYEPGQDEGDDQEPDGDMEEDRGGPEDDEGCYLPPPVETPGEDIEDDFERQDDGDWKKDFQGEDERFPDENVPLDGELNFEPPIYQNVDS